MATDNRTNAETLSAAFAAADAGDPVPLVQLFDDRMTWAGFTFAGTQTVYSKDEFLAAFGILAKLDESKNEVLSAQETEDGLVTALLRAYRRLGDDELDIQMVMTFRFVDGRITRGTDMVPPSFEAFWERTGLVA